MSEQFSPFSPGSSPPADSGQGSKGSSPAPKTISRLKLVPSESSREMLGGRSIALGPRFVKRAST